MARIRTVKPEFFSDEDLGGCTHATRLLAIALLQLADSKGRMRWIPSQVTAHTFPWEAIDISPLLHELESIGYLVLYKVNGKEYAYIPGFTRHQRLSGKEAQQESNFPSPDQEDSDGKQRGKTERYPGKHLDAQEQGTGNREQGKDILSGKPDVADREPDAVEEEPEKKPRKLEAEVITYLNEVTGKSFRPVDSNLKFIRARLAEGYSPEELRAVVERKHAEWGSDDHMRQYLRPSTLFNAENFNQYVGELDQPLPARRTHELRNGLFSREQTRNEKIASFARVAFSEPPLPDDDGDDWAALERRG